jgi:hypothetical protein
METTWKRRLVRVAGEYVFGLKWNIIHCATLVLCHITRRLTYNSPAPGPPTIRLWSVDLSLPPELAIDVIYR